MSLWLWRVLIIFLIFKYSNSFNDGPFQYAPQEMHNGKCDCVPIKDCNYFVRLLSKTNTQERLDLLNSKMRQSLCNRNREETMVCCPNYNEISKIDKTRSNDLPWIWGSRKLTNLEDQRLTFNNRFNFDLNGNGDNTKNIIDLDDPDTNNNYPPNLHDYNSFPFPNYNKEFSNDYSPFSFRLNHFGHERHATPNSGRSHLEPRQFVGKSLFNSYKNNGVNSPSCGLSVNTRIVGGRDVGTVEFPWIARLAYLNKFNQTPPININDPLNSDKYDLLHPKRDKSILDRHDDSIEVSEDSIIITSGKISFRCAGSFISERDVITAAHCVTNLINNRKLMGVRVGGSNKIRSLDCNLDPILCRVPQDYKIESIIPHPNFDSNKFSNDIAIIRLIRPSNSVAITPICLPFGNFDKDDSTLTGRFAIVAGWKTILSYSQSSKTQELQTIRLPIINRTQCAITYAQFTANSKYPIEITTRQICVQGETNMNTCAGDSGSPLMDEGKDRNNRYVLLGLVSFGSSECGNSHFPEVYTKISPYIDWIVSIIRS